MIRYRHHEPILLADKAWELNGLMTAVTVLNEPDKDALRMYYLVRFQAEPLKSVLCVADSDDGFEWQKPDLGDGTNIVMRSSGFHPAWGMFSPKSILHDRAEANPEQRWKMLYWDRPAENSPPGMCLAISPDGLRWRPVSDRPIITGANDAGSLLQTKPGSISPLRKGPFLIYQQTWKYNPGLPQARDNLKRIHRRISLWTCANFFDDWIGPITVLEPDAADAPDLQFYNLTVFRTQTGYGGLLACHHTGDQTMDVQWVRSADGWLWHRANDRQPILPLGEKGRFDCGMAYAVSPPVKFKEKVLLFYNGRATVHDGNLHYPDQPRPNPEKGISVAEMSDDLLI
ncbi:hypothetical protein JXJ21_05740 [candidate division KSB1 bacterium]|nr:hypothetical protein [candidate division KSB1 bacterium]